MVRFRYFFKIDLNEESSVNKEKAVISFKSVHQHLVSFLFAIPSL